MLDIKALLIKLMNTETFGDLINDIAPGNTRFSSFSSMHNGLAKINNAMHDLNVYASSDNYTVVDSSHHYAIRAIEQPTGSSENSAYSISEYYHGQVTGVYILFSGYISTWASSTSTSGTQYRQAATLTFSSTALPLAYTSSIPLCLLSIMNSRVIGCSAAFTAARTVTLNAILTTSTTLTNSNGWINLFIYQPYTTNSGTMSDSIVVHEKN